MIGGGVNPRRPPCHPRGPGGVRDRSKKRTLTNNEDLVMEMVDSIKLDSKTQCRKLNPGKARFDFMKHLLDDELRAVERSSLVRYPKI